MTRVLVVTGGPDYAHDFDATGAALAALAGAVADEVDVVAHPDAAARRLADRWDALVINALWWRMLDTAYDHLRPQWGYTTSSAVRESFAAFVAAGGGLLASHTATICFDDWPEWGAIVGGAWQWGRSSHPPLGPVDARLVGAHPVVAGMPPSLELDDEVYGDLALQPGVDVLAVARRGPDDADQPVVWTHRYGNGRVVYDGFGHDTTSLVQPDHHRLLRQALEWVVGSG
jgi:type 1 glutamine amidotransferase